MKPIGVISLLLAFLTLITVATVAQDRGPVVVMQGPGPMGMGPGPGMGMGPHHGHFGAWWKNSDVVKELQLTDTQVKQIEQTFLDYRLKLIDLRADVERQETKLQPLLEADQPNEQQVSSQVDAVVAARGKLEKTNTMMMLAIRRVLTVDQWKKLQSIEHSRNVMWRMRGGPGEGFHGPRRGDAAPEGEAPRPPAAPADEGD